LSSLLRLTKTSATTTGLKSSQASKRLNSDKIPFVSPQPQQLIKMKIEF